MPEPQMPEPQMPEPSPTAAATRVLDAALVCVARFGVAKTTIDDVAREAGVSRATVYRLFPGKQPLLGAAVDREVGVLEERLHAAASGADTLTELLVAVIVTAARHVEHHAALHTVLTHEPEVLLRALTFDGAGDTLARAGRLLAPLLAPHVGAAHSERAGEWVARIVLAYVCAPSDVVVLNDADSVRALVVDLVAPSIAPAAALHSSLQNSSHRSLHEG